MRRFAKALTGVTEIVAILSAVGFLAGLFGRHFWLLDLASHFRFQYLAVFAFGAVVFAINRRWSATAASGCAAVALGASLLPYVPGDVPASPGGLVKVVSFNVNTANDRYADVLTYLLEQDADIVVLLEVSSEWIEQIAALDSTYPHSFVEPRNDNFGIAIYSKHALLERDLIKLTEHRIESLAVVVRIAGQSLRIVGTHPLPPTSASNAAARDVQLRMLGQPPHAMPTLLIGDFNLTQFSPIFADLLQVSGLRDTAIGHGLPPTWMRAIPVFAIPIDQALVTPGITVVDRWTGPSLGSDHVPLLVTFSLN